MEGPISFWGYKEQESNLILPEHDDDDDGDDDILCNFFCSDVKQLIYKSYHNTHDKHHSQNIPMQHWLKQDASLAQNWRE
jgi:hypothetical protein